MKRRLGINTICTENIDDLQSLDLIKESGFDCFFTSSRVTDTQLVGALRKKGDELGLQYEFIHAPFKGVNAMWEESDFTQSYMQSIFHALDNASEYGVPSVIMHASSTWTPPPVTENGLKRYDKLVAYATKKGVKLAFENLRVHTYYEMLLKRYENEAFAGFCYDNGHEHCCTPEIPHIRKYCDKMICTHIHDNFGKLENYLTVDGDLHLMPFNGNFDFQKMMDDINQYGYQGSLTLEVGPKGYATEKEFYADAFVRLDKIAKL